VRLLRSAGPGHRPPGHLVRAQPGLGDAGGLLAWPRGRRAPRPPPACTPSSAPTATSRSRPSRTCSRAGWGERTAATRSGCCAARAYAAEQVRKRRLALREDGFEELYERVGQDLRRLMGELDKLEAFAGDAKGPLGADEVSSVLGRGLAQPLYRLGDAFAARRRAEVLALMETVLEEGEAALEVLATLHYLARRVRRARARRGSRMPPH